MVEVEANTITYTHKENVTFDKDHRYRAVRFHDCTPKEIAEWLEFVFKDNWKIHSLYIKQEMSEEDKAKWTIKP